MEINYSSMSQRELERIRHSHTLEFISELSKLMPEDQRLIMGFAERANITKAEADTKNSGWWPEPYGQRTTLYSTRNDYISIASAIKTENPKTGKMRYWRGTASFGAGLAFYVDDIGAGTGSKGEFSLMELCGILEPTVVIETSPGNYQAWYFFSRAVMCAATFKGFLDGFTKHVLKNRGGDTTINDIMRVGRLPFGINNKVLEDGTLKYGNEAGEPWKVRMIQCDYSKRYTMEEIAMNFNFPMEIRRPKAINFDTDELKWGAFALAVATQVLSKAGMGEAANGEVRANQSDRYRIRCPWGHTHTNGDPRGAYFRGPVRGEDAPFVFGCSHHSCKERYGWEEFTDEVVMPIISSIIEKSNKSPAYEQLMGWGRGHE